MPTQKNTTAVSHRLPKKRRDQPTGIAGSMKNDQLDRLFARMDAENTPEDDQALLRTLRAIERP